MTNRWPRGTQCKNNPTTQLVISKIRFFPQNFGFFIYSFHTFYLIRLADFILKFEEKNDILYKTILSHRVICCFILKVLLLHIL